MKKLLLLLTVFTVFLAGCSQEQKTEETGTIYTSIYALELITESITNGTSLNVESIIPEGGDSHHYELTTSQIQEITNSNLFIYMDQDFEEFTSDLIDSGLSQMLEINNNPLFLSEINPSDLNEEGGVVDYHTFLYPVYASIIAEVIANELSDLFPENKSIFMDNLKTFQAEMNELNNQWLELEETQLVTNHDAYYYWEEYYNITIMPVYNGSHDDEPSTQDIQNIIEYIENNQIQFFYEENNNIPSPIIDTIINETNIQVLPLYNFELPVAEINNMNYNEIMLLNLENIKKGN